MEFNVYKTNLNIRVRDRHKLALSHGLYYNHQTNMYTSIINRFDCGSGVGVVRSEETVLLNQWNHITLYRHRWDAWLQLNKYVKKN